MYHIKSRAIAEIEIKKSRFIGILIPVQPDTDIKSLLADVRKEYPNATHYCTALITGNIQRSNDDGEPSGTAGLPMLECLRHRDLDNVLLVVVRYFGGTLLGTGGLVRAYQQSAQQAIAAASLTVPVEVGRYSIKVPYDLISRMENLLQNKAVIVNREYGEQAEFTYDCEEDISEECMSLTAGRCKPQYMETLIIEKEIQPE